MFELFHNYKEVHFICPRCGGEEYSVWKLPNILLLHWVLNPGLAVNELILGQRQPSRIYFCRCCPKPMMECQYVYCPNCGQFHDGMIWSENHAFGHWLGIVCPDCACLIPSLLNITSWLILTRFSPICWLLWWCFGERYQVFEQQRAFRIRAEREALYQK